MATLYLKAAGGNFNGANTWSTVNAGGADNSGPPAAGDNCIAELASGAVTINSGSVCRSFDTTSGTGSYGGAITHTAGVTWTIGDGTAGTGSVALKFNSGMSYSLGDAATSALSFVSTSATKQTITAAGKSFGNTTFNSSSNGNYALVDSVTIGITGTITLTQGTLQTDGTSDNSGLTHSVGIFSTNNSNTRVLKLGNSTITCTLAPGGAGTAAWDVSTATGMSLTAGTSTITLNGSGSTFTGGAGLTYATVNMTGSSSQGISGATFGTLSRTGTAVKTDSFKLFGSFTVNTAFVINGNSSTNRMLLTSSTLGTARTITLGGSATFRTSTTTQNVDIRDVTMAGGAANELDLSAITGLSGDCGGNSGITFTTGQSNYWIGDNGSWSSVGEWANVSGGSASSGRVPLPQDDVFFDVNSFVAGGETVTADMPRLGKSIDWTGATGSPTWAVNSIANTLYGSLTLISGMTYTGNSGLELTFEGRSSSTLTSAGKTFSSIIGIRMFGGTMTLQDAFACNVSDFRIVNGTFNANNFNLTLASIDFSFTTTKVMNMGSGTWTCTRSSSNAWFGGATGTGTTLNANTSTILISNTGASSKTFSGAGLTYNNLQIAGGGSGAVIITGANTFHDILVVGGTKSITLPGATTTTITGGSQGFGNASSGSVVTITASAGSATVSKSSGVFRGDFLNLTNIPSTGGAVFFAGPLTHSTDGGGNTGWIFTQAPGAGGTTLVDYASGPPFSAVGLF